MTIPDYQIMMRPILEICKNSKKNTNDVIREIAEKYKLSKEDLEILQTPIFEAVTQVGLNSSLLSLTDNNLLCCCIFTTLW